MISVVSVVLLKSLFTTSVNNSYILYYSLKLPLIGLTTFVILQIVLMVIWIAISSRKEKTVLKFARHNDI